MKNFTQHRALFGYLISGIIFTVMVYNISIHTTNDLIGSCERQNQERVSNNVTSKGTDEVINVLEDYMQARLDGDTSKIAEGAPVVRKTLRTLKKFTIETDLPIIDCNSEFPMPFPHTLIHDSDLKVSDKNNNAN